MQPTYDFTGQVAFVTGAGSGMGLATARAYAAAGAAVVLADIDEAAVTAARALADDGHDALGVQCDVTREDSVAAAVAATVEQFGRLDVAFNNAGIMVPATDAADEPVDQFDRVQSVNLRGVWACTKHQLRQMREQQGGGAIVNCSSLGGLVGAPGRAAYHASKFGVIGLTRSVAIEYASQGIRVNAICPGTIATPMVDGMVASGDLDLDAAAGGAPIGRLGRPEEIAAAVLWLTSPGASYVVGVALPVDGGYVA
jgi:NAD(P)-dependent dehydrogenase (short-subunit alcohol dehydrogenase family)